MSAKRSTKNRLGRGLDALLGEASAGHALDTGLEVDQTLRELPVEQLQRGRYQPRRHVDDQALQALAQSIQAQGIIQPILVRRNSLGGYEIIAGERRWRAAQLAGLETVPVVIREVTDETAMAMALIENIQRENLNPIEEANGISRLIDEFKLTHQQVGGYLGRSRAQISNLLRLLTLRREIRQMVEQGQLDMGHARALLGLPESQRMAIARQVLQKNLSVRATEKLVQRCLSTSEQADRGGSGRSYDVDIQNLETTLSERIQARVRIQHGPKKGRLLIEYHSLEELEGILARIH
ncbi:MAG TPA: ParB/RepB/Spo0J family partition protein [Gammaproteobacteria bacterium]|nr:ParB/RepB/Spo0J family partition protein [Gammaproteobacteria bacterium]